MEASNRDRFTYLSLAVFCYTAAAMRLATYTVIDVVSVRFWSGCGLQSGPADRSAPRRWLVSSIVWSGRYKSRYHTSSSVIYVISHGVCAQYRVIFSLFFWYEMWPQLSRLMCVPCLTRSPQGLLWRINFIYRWSTTRYYAPCPTRVRFPRQFLGIIGCTLGEI